MQIDLHKPCVVQLNFTGRKYFNFSQIEPELKDKVMDKNNKPASETDKTFEYIFENITDGILVVDAEIKKFTLGNRAICRMLGYTKKELSEISIYDIHPKEVFPHLEESLQKVLNKEIELLNDIPVLTKSGTLFYADIAASPIQYNNRAQIVATFRNITDRRKAEKEKDAVIMELHKSETRLSAVINQAAIAIAISKDQKLIFVNPQFIRMFGYDDVSELTGRSIYDIISIDEHSRVMAVEVPSREKELVVNELETAVLRKDGSEFWIHAAISNIYDYGSLGFITDITDRVKAEKELKRKEELLRATLNTTADGILLVDNNNKIRNINRQFIEMWNIPEYILDSDDDSSLLSVITNQVSDPEKFIEKVEFLYGNDQESVDEVSFKDGRIFERYSSPLISEGVKFGRIWDYRDITDRKHAEEELRKNEAIMNTLFDAAPVGIVLLVNRIHVKINSMLSKLTGYSPEEILGHSTEMMYFTKEESDRTSQKVYAEVKEKGFSMTEAILRRKDGSIFNALLCIRSINPEDISAGVIAVTLDITDRKHTEEALKSSEALLRSIFEASPAGIALMRMDRTILKLNKSLCRITGYSYEELLGKTTRHLYFSDEEYNRIAVIYREMQRDGLGMGDACLKRKDGSLINVLVCLSKVNPDDLNSGVIATILDITALKKTEEALRESEEKYRTLVDNMQDGAYRCDLNGNLVFVSPSSAKILGLLSPELMIGMNLERDLYYYPEERGSLLKALNEHGKVTHYEVTLKRKDNGNPVVISTNSQYYLDKNGNIIGVEGVFTDISERKQTEEALKNSEALLRSIFEASSAGIALLVDRKFLKVNDSFCRITGYSEEELLGQTSQHLYFDEEEYERLGLLYKDVQQKRLGMAEARMRRKDGDVINLIICLSPVNPDDLKGNYIATILDITALKKTEEALRESEEKYRTLVDNMQDGAYRCDLNGNLVFVSPSAAKMLGYSSPELMMGMNISEDFYYYPEEREKLIKVLDENGKVTHYDVTLKRHDNGKPVLISTNSQFYFGKDGNIVGIEGVFSDVTERKHAEEALKKSEALLSRMIEASPAGILVLVARVPRKVNRALCRITGYSQEEMISQSTRHLYFSDEEYARVGEAYKEMNSDGLSIIETRLRHKEGFELNVLIYISHINPDNPQEGDVAVILDITDLKRAESALRESEEKYRTIVDNMQDIVYRCDLNGTITYSSPSAVPLLGCSSAESMIGMSIKDFFNYPDNDADYKKQVKYLLENGRMNQYEVTLKRIDNGEPVIVLANSRLYRNKEGNIVGVEGVYTDITRRKMAEEALKNSEEFLRKIFDVSPIGIILLVERVFMKVNDYICRISGYTEQELLGQSARILYINDKAFNRVGDEIYPQMEKGGIGMTESLIRRKDGTVINVMLCMSRLDAADKKKEVVVTIQDITERKQAEEALKKNEAMLKSLLDATPIGVSLLINRIHIKVNNSLCRILGYSEQELLGQSTQIFYSNEEEYKKMDALYEQMEREGIAIKESQIKRKDGVLLDTILCLSPFDINDKSAGVALTILDITEQKKVEAERTHLQEMLLHSQKIESLGRLAGGIAHDFNNLLTAIMGNTEMAMRQLDPSGKPYSRLTVIKSAAEGAANLTRQLLAFSRKQIIEPKIINLNDLIEHVYKMILTLIGENIKLHIIYNKELASIKADPGQIEQVVINLAANARDAMPDGGDLTIETSEVYLDQKYVKLHPDLMPGNYIMIAVNDTGAGMSKDTMIHAFEPFFTTKELGRGTGLGLATVYGIVKQNGGTIEVYSEISHGTVFKVYFPVSSQPKSDLQQFEETSMMPAGTETVLVVEDKVEVLEFCRDVLVQLGYNVLTAESGEQALSVSDNYKDIIQLFMTDVVLPGMNGRAAAERISSLRPGIKILYNSGYTAEVIDKQGILEKGINFISKPFTSQELSVKIREILDKKF